MSALFRLFSMLLVLVYVASACTSIPTPEPTPTLRPSPTKEATPTPEPPDKILFIGNSLTSWNDGVDWHLEQLLSSAIPPLDTETDSSTLGGASLEQHWDYPLPRDKIANEGYDLVVLQEDFLMTSSWIESGTVDSFYEYARKFDAEIKAAGAETMLYMAELYEETGVKPISHDEIAQAHREIATELGIDVAPVDLAFQLAMEQRPELDLVYRDGIHPSIFGTYLAASVMYATIFGESPSGLPYLPPESLYVLSNGDKVHGITEEEAAFLHRIAWETVQEYQAQE